MATKARKARPASPRVRVPAPADVTAMLVGETWMRVTPGTFQVQGPIVAWVDVEGAPCVARLKDVAVWRGTPPPPPEAAA